MGTPAHALKQRSDNKLYRIQTPQVPLVQNKAHSDYQMDEYPQGTNAVVAVISYTGYDMEDAMIINKGAFDRGFGNGHVYKTKVVDLDEESKKANSTGSKPSLRFGNVKEPPLGPGAAIAGEKFCEMLDIDGLPFEGEAIEYGDPICCFIDDISGEHRVIKHKDNERVFVDTVRVLCNDKKNTRRVSITLRYPRRPVIGDKFSSRHGQKGTLSVLWPQEDMPFSEHGMVPDVLINPHAFPSRMTIGMLIESMAGKSGAMHGIFQESTPFQFHEEQKAIDYFGEQLRSAGFHYYGSEPLYSGIHGTLMKTDIFIGLVYYQRLRHMVSDKSQVRSTGAVMGLTRQPVKGRKVGGGIRLGEMERDALLSHGVSFCLHDRLMNSSDSHLAYVCADCGELLPVRATKRSSDIVAVAHKAFHEVSSRATQTCINCNSSTGVRSIHLPYIYRYLCNELAGMGIKISLKLSDKPF